MSTYLNSFYPLCCTKEGVKAAEQGLPLFIDGSIRREPDFENVFPAITGLCRTNKLGPRLAEGDRVIYITNKGNYFGLRQWCMVAVLEVMSIKPSHRAAADFYRERKLQIPQNLMVPEMVKKPIQETHQFNREFKQHGIINVDKWDNAYKLTSIKYPLVAICQIFDNRLYLNRPLSISYEIMIAIFNRIPGLQTPPKLTEQEETNFFNWLSS